MSRSAPVAMAASTRIADISRRTRSLSRLAPGRNMRALLVRPAPLHARHQQIAVHARDKLHADLLRADRRALADIRTAAEALLVHHLDHAHHPRIPLRLALRQHAQVRDL